MRVGNLPGIRRLPVYLDILRKLRESGTETVSAHILAVEAGLLVSGVRKDLEMTGATGKTGVGFSIDSLVASIETFLGWDNPYQAFLAGAGNLGSALLGYEGFRNHGLHIVAAFDVNPGVIGRIVHDVKVWPLDELCGLAQRLHVNTGIITVPSSQAQSVADLFVTAGITRIWSFAPEILRVPSNVIVQREDLAAGLAELLVRSARRRVKI
ncbi:MAG: redox-sensing transcriptional repressor Rex [Desulfovibrio sp.]|nr:redox-sensing transcriptional repressor Rex [Desulfovibrio sp.]